MMKLIEERLDTLGTVLIYIGWFAGFLSVITSFIESEIFYLFMSPGLVISGYMSGYIYKGISKIIELLHSSSSIVKNNKNHSFSTFTKSSQDIRDWDEISKNMKK